MKLYAAILYPTRRTIMHIFMQGIFTVFNVFRSFLTTRFMFNKRNEIVTCIKFQHVHSHFCNFINIFRTKPSVEKIQILLTILIILLHKARCNTAWYIYIYIYISKHTLWHHIKFYPKFATLKNKTCAHNS